MSTITRADQVMTQVKESESSDFYSFEPRENTFDNATDIVCLSHLRWDFVYQRPQHLLSRCARERRVFFFEEPLFTPGAVPTLDVRMRENGVCIVTPRLAEGLSDSEIQEAQQILIKDLFRECDIRDHILWYYTPTALTFTRHLEPLAIVYDCMDELTGFKGAPSNLKQLEAELFAHADVVFTGGRSLYEAKRHSHSNIHACPSSIDSDHFGQARLSPPDPADQVSIAHPRLGFFGVIDERMDCELLAGIADARPEWQLIMIGPVVKIDESVLPRRSNIHYLGGKGYDELPRYIAGWDAALLLFAHNESTRFISPTKTPEYLAAGKPVISTSILDVVSPYGEMGLVRVADGVKDFVAAIEAALNEDARSPEWLERVDRFLAKESWDSTWLRMMRLMDSAIGARTDETVTTKPSVANASA
ncbi:MAG: glycosyltransferase family 1 protein [Blastocatellia bacterium]